MEWRNGFEQMQPHEFSEEGLAGLDQIRTRLSTLTHTAGNSAHGQTPWKPFLLTDKEELAARETRGVIIVGNPETLSDADLRMTQTQDRFILGSQSQTENQFLFQTQAVSNTKILQEELMTLNDGGSTHLTTSALITFVASNPRRLPELCEELNICDLKDSTVEILFAEIFQLDKEPSLSWCCAFTDIYFARKLASLERLASRNSTNVLSQFCRRFPRAVVDHLMVPCISSPQFGTNQLDVIKLLLTDCLSDEHQIQFLRQVLELRQPWNDVFILLLTKLIDIRLMLTEDILNLFVQRFSEETELLNSNINFGKLLRSFISQHLKEFTPTHYSVLSSVTNQNKTLCRGGCLQLLKKIKP